MATRIDREFVEKQKRLQTRVNVNFQIQRLFIFSLRLTFISRGGLKTRGISIRELNNRDLAGKRATPGDSLSNVVTRDSIT